MRPRKALYGQPAPAIADPFLCQNAASGVLSDDGRPTQSIPLIRFRNMALTGRYIFTASMDVDPDKEDLFNEVYDTEHVPNLLKVPGVIATSRVINQDFSVNMAGEVKSVSLTDEPKYTAIYEVESPEVLTSQAWADAIEDGRWPAEVRPYTHNRRHTFKKVMG